MFNPFTYKTQNFIVTVTGENLHDSDKMFLDLDTKKDEIKKLIKAQFDRNMLGVRQDYRDNIMSDMNRNKADDKLRKQETQIKDMLHHTYMTLFNEVPYGIN